MKRKLLFKTIIVAAMLCMGTSAWAVVNTDSQGRKQYVWNLGCEAKSAAGTYYLKAGEYAYADYSTTYKTSGNYDIAMVVITGGSGRQIYANTSADSDKGGGAAMGSSQGYLEFYAPVDGVVTLVGCYADRPKIYNKTTSTDSGSNKYLSVSAGNKIQIYSGSGCGVEKIVLTENYYGETMSNPSHALSESSLTITPGVASWTAGGVTREASAGASTYSTSQTINPSVTTYYTTDGTTPTTSSSVYSSAIDVSAIATVKYYSVSASGLASDVKAWSTTMLPVSTATTWNFSTISETLGGYICDGTLYVGSSITDDRASNKRVKFATALDAVPTAVGANIISFKTGVAGQVIMKLADYGSSSISVSDGSSAVATFAGTNQDGKSQANASYHGGGTYFKYATFQAAANTQYYIYATNVSTTGVYSINFQPTGNNTTTSLTEETTWSFITQKDILTEYHGITKDNMYFGDGLTDVHTSSVGYRITFNGTGNTATGENVLSFKLPANVKGYISLMPSCYNHKLVLKAGETTLKEFNTGDGGDHNKDISVWVTTDAETTIYLYSPDASITSNQPGTRYITWTPAPENVSATITAAGWATLYTPYPLDFSSLSTHLTAYTATCTSSIVTLTPVTNVPANTGVVLKGTADTYYIPTTASSSTDKGHMLGSATEATAYDAFDGYDLYMLVKNASNEAQFKKVSNGSIAAGKAFLKINNSGASALSPVMNVVFADDNTTGINTIQGSGLMVNGYYDLQGRKVANPTKGLYIVNGKKVIIK